MATGNGEPKKYSAWESILWHFQSRRSRAALVALLACVILNHPKLREFFGVDEKTAATFANQLIILAGIVIAALTGEKFVPNGNGNGKPAPASVDDAVLEAAGEKIKDKLDEAIEKKVDKLVDKIKEKLKP